MITQLQLFQVSERALLLKDKIIGKMRAERVTDLSDDAIEKVFKYTCAPTRLIACTKELRDNGLLTINDLKYDNEII